LATAPLIYALPSSFAPDTLVALDWPDTTIVPEGRERLARVYLDTFDWRFFAAGEVLEALVHPGAGAELVLRRLGTGEVLGTQRVAGLPRFAEDLTYGAVGTRLAGVLGVRALLPLVRLEADRLRFSLRDGEDKTVLRLEYQRERHAGKTLAPRLQVLPVRGYVRARKAVLRALAGLGGVVPAPEDPLFAASALAGRVPGDYRSKLELALDPNQRADVAGRTVLRALFTGLERNEAGVRADWDSEFLHDFRVAVRRTRSFLSQVKGVFPSQRVDRFGREFAWLQGLTGPTRDMDVYLLAFDGFKAELPGEQGEDLEPFRAFLRRHKAAEHGRLIQGLDSSRYTRLKRDWRAFLAAAPPVSSTLDHAMEPIRVVASRRIRRMERRALDEGRAIGPDSPAEALHELRKTCKKLRYLMEFFRSLYPREAIAGLIKELKRLQDNLGEFQDLQVQQEALARFIEAMRAEAALPAPTEAAMHRLMSVLHGRQLDARAEFAERFAQFDSPGNRKRFKALFGKAVGPAMAAA
jgi:CHAD domain-containing protein